MPWALAIVAVWGLAARHLLLAIPGDVVIWASWVYVNPMTKCAWCNGSGRHVLSGKKFFGSCWNPRCQRGVVQRAGSKTVHRAVRGLVTYKKKGQ